MNTAFLEFSGVRKNYGQGGRETRALDSIDLSVRKEEFLSIVGPSGCGKSTLLKCVAGLERVTEGRISLGGEEILQPPEQLGVVFQADTLAAWRTILDNVLLVAEFKGMDTRALRGRALNLLKMFGLEQVAEKSPWELSGGMRQRAAICRALLDDPPLLLMDEPFGALDPMTREQLNVELQRVWLESRKTVLFITHSIAEAVFLSDRVAVMSRNPGRLVDVIKIDLPRPRHLSIRETPEFGVYVGRIREIFLSLGILKNH
jgi:NitT/TauT family transport system ATP-binding protein